MLAYSRRLHTEAGHSTLKSLDFTTEQLDAGISSVIAGAWDDRMYHATRQLWHLTEDRGLIEGYYVEPFGSGSAEVLIFMSYGDATDSPPDRLIALFGEGWKYCHRDGLLYRYAESLEDTMVAGILANGRAFICHPWRDRPELRLLSDSDAVPQ